MHTLSDGMRETISATASANLRRSGAEVTEESYFAEVERLSAVLGERRVDPVDAAASTAMRAAQSLLTLRGVVEPTEEELLRAYEQVDAQLRGVAS